MRRPFETGEAKAVETLTQHDLIRSLGCDYAEALPRRLFDGGAASYSATLNERHRAPSDSPIRTITAPSVPVPASAGVVASRTQDPLWLGSIVIPRVDMSPKPSAAPDLGCASLREVT